MVGFAWLRSGGDAMVERSTVQTSHTVMKAHQVKEPRS